ncbi:MAG: HEAT repeat domain-containing protein [Actinobacteria bacterium]|nr:HEAT repeat domain-containing protein [Actinomycetota bacterium]
MANERGAGDAGRADARRAGAGDPGDAGRTGAGRTDAGRAGADVAARRRTAVVAGHERDETAARRLLGDEDPSVRAAALGALVLAEAVRAADLAGGLADPVPSVRRRTLELVAALSADPVGGDPPDEAPAARLARPGREAPGSRQEREAPDSGQAREARPGREAALASSVLPLLDDADPSVVEVAAWACGERVPPEAGAVARLATLATGHDDALVREAAVAALGAIGDPAGLPAVLAACRDKATVRRRAVLALAPFDGPEVDAALRAALEDRDWQVRQAAEDLT